MPTQPHPSRPGDSPILPLPPDEPARLDALCRYGILDTPPETEFDDLTRLAAHVCGTPIAIVSLVDEKRQWFKSRVGLEAPETPRDIAFCAHAIQSPEVFIVADAAADPRFCDNPLVTDGPQIRFYTGVPLTTPDGFRLGTLSVIDVEPRTLEPLQLELLQGLARQVVSQLELRRQLQEVAMARELALQASRAKSQFLANMSHELRTPMNAILGMTDLLAETPLNTEQAQYVRVSRRAGQNLLDLLSDLLDLHRVESDQLELEVQDYAPADLAGQVLELYTLPARQKGLHARLQLEPGLPELARGDRTRLQQVLVNLLDNAVKFTENGEIGLRIACREGADRMLEFHVWDTGIGIPAASLHTVFDSFAQVDSSNTRKHGGAGLGLAICHRLAELMGGSLTVKSDLNQGTRFMLTVPIGTVDSPVGTAEPPAPASEARSPMLIPVVEAPQRSGLTESQEEPRALRILLAEDSPDNRMLIQAYLKRTPYRVEMVENGDAAVREFLDGGYDLVLMDMQMPIKDGYTAVREIREWEEAQGRTHTPIVALTAHALREDEQRSLDAGCTAHVAKPVRKATLLAEIARHTSAA